MIAKFQIILEGVTPLKIQCLKTFPDEKLEAERIHQHQDTKHLGFIIKATRIYLQQFYQFVPLIMMGWYIENNLLSY